MHQGTLLSVRCISVRFNRITIDSGGIIDNEAKMRSPVSWQFTALLLAAAVVLPQLVFCTEEHVGSDFAEQANGFQMQDLEQERVCRPPTAVPPELVAPLASSAPPPLPYNGFALDLAVVFQRHGSRRSMLGDDKSKSFYGKTHPGQLLVQGAYELRVAGAEMRRYLMNALGFESTKVTPQGSSSSSDAKYRKTLGLELVDECRMAKLSLQTCTLSTLVAALGYQIPSEAVYARSSALPRTMWSGLAFLEGFYGLPFGCAGTVEELNKTAGGRTADVCLRRTACDSSFDDKGLINTLRDVCTSRRLPCVHTAPVEEDGLMCGATVSKQAYHEANEHYRSKGVNRTYVPQDPNILKALEIAEEIWGEKVLGKGLSWMAGEMALSEQAAGAETPLASLATWVEEQKRKREDPAATSRPEQVPTYESLLVNLVNAYKEGTNVQYADGQFSRYVVSPAVALQNALFRVKAFEREEDWTHLQVMLELIGGFEGLKQEAAIEKLKMLVINFHDFILLGWMELLGIHDGGLTPFAGRLTFELSHPEADTAFRGTIAKGGDNDTKEGNGGHKCQCGCGGKGKPASPEEYSWPRSSHVVRVLVGSPGAQLEPFPLPWCDSGTGCPLDKWLSYTYGKISGHCFYDIASNFRQRYEEAQEAVARRSGSST